ncbi:hypothetical protein [Streptomyces sp. NRRL B-24720]|uniref:hypothetical protein n=1 Tax=Streptomyces sp. NRRL B-24720 TaxID=1476876 RepID=UPI00068F45E7|nr:hypothetical protein [Streptomyces sp. NRRL B-24720]
MSTGIIVAIERAVESGDSRTAAERDLREREQRHDDLDLKPLPTTARQQYAQEWNSVQEHFVDRPQEAVGEADQLVTRLMKERGYPTQDYATTEELRGAMVHYRALFDDLLTNGDRPGQQHA